MWINPDVEKRKQDDELKYAVEKISNTMHGRSKHWKARRLRALAKLKKRRKK